MTFTIAKFEEQLTRSSTPIYITRDNIQSLYTELSQHENSKLSIHVDSFRDNQSDILPQFIASLKNLPNKAKISALV